MNVLVERIMDSLDVVVEPFALCELGTGSELPIGELGWLTIHFVIAGEGQVVCGPRKTLDMPKYSLSLVKRDHRLHATAGDGSDLAVGQLDGVTHLVGVPSGDPDFVVACGKIQANYGPALGLFDLIDDPLVVAFDQSAMMRELFHLILRESSQPNDGSLAMIEAAMRQCLVLLLRELSRDGTEGLAWVEALRNEQMAAVVERVLDRPEAAHTVQSLADTAHMSRSAFASHFKRSFGLTPMSFVRAIRLKRSADLLKTTRDSIATIARKSGFASRSYYAEAFKKEFGVSPGRFRRQ